MNVSDFRTKFPGHAEVSDIEVETGLVRAMATYRIREEWAVGYLTAHFIQVSKMGPDGSELELADTMWGRLAAKRLKRFGTEDSNEEKN